MEYIIKGYGCESFFKYFEEISAIPRGSGNEKAIADYIVDFAKKRELFVIRDDTDNVFIRKPATKGYEDVPAIILQGHTDMVCEKNSDSAHDFENDPLELYIDNGLLRARGTTLGGDDGVAVAAMLDILDDDTLEHPVIECLFTTGEETGLYGAHNFDCSNITARRLLNLDTELDGEAIASCAGSADITLTLDGEQKGCSEHTLDITVKGLAGGHSGADINLGRENAIRLLGRILARLYDDTPFNLVTLSGGNKRNAIPREAYASVVVLDLERAKSIVEDEAGKISAEIYAATLARVDSGFKVFTKRGRIVEKCFTYKDTSTVINMLTLPANGVVSYAPLDNGFVRTSANSGVVACSEGKVTLDIMARSSCDSEMDALLINYVRLAKLLGVEYQLEGRSGGWELNPDSKLAEDYLRVYKSLFPDTNPIVSSIHAGLECGIFVSKVEGLDALSIGPTIYDIHSPDEALDLLSCVRFSKLIRALVSDK